MLDIKDKKLVPSKNKLCQIEIHDQINVAGGIVLHKINGRGKLIFLFHENYYTGGNFVKSDKQCFYLVLDYKPFVKIDLPVRLLVLIE